MNMDEETLEVFRLVIGIDEVEYEAKNTVTEYLIQRANEYANKLGKRNMKIKDYWIVDVIDDSSQSTKIKCWGIRPGDEVFVNRPYVAKLDYDETWGFSCRGVFNFKMIG